MSEKKDQVGIPAHSIQSIASFIDAKIVSVGEKAVTLFFRDKIRANAAHAFFKQCGAEKGAPYVLARESDVKEGKPTGYHLKVLVVPAPEGDLTDLGGNLGPVELLPFQREGGKFIEAHGHHSIVASEKNSVICMSSHVIVRDCGFCEGSGTIAPIGREAKNVLDFSFCPRCDAKGVVVIRRMPDVCGKYHEQKLQGAHKEANPSLVDYADTLREIERLEHSTGEFIKKLDDAAGEAIGKIPCPDCDAPKNAVCEGSYRLLHVCYGRVRAYLECVFDRRKARLDKQREEMEESL